MDNLYVFRSIEKYNPFTELMIQKTCENFKAINIFSREESKGVSGNKLLFVANIDDTGVDIYLLKLINSIVLEDKNYFEGKSGILLVKSSTEYFTKRFSQHIIFLLNSYGLRFMGHPLVEATSTLYNFKTWQKTINTSLENICLMQCSNLGERFLNYNTIKIENPNILVIYSKLNPVSNTYDFWNKIKKTLDSNNIYEINIENGKISDCKGCSYKTCSHFGENNQCFYGGIMTDSVLPMIEKADAVIFLCPNYNDCLPANLTALINRLTVLYTKMTFNKKTLFGVIVSGNSGSDSIATQLIGSLNINKGFSLPPKAFAMATANDPLSINYVLDIDNISSLFGENIKSEIKK